MFNMAFGKKLALYGLGAATVIELLTQIAIVLMNFMRLDYYSTTYYILSAITGFTRLIFAGCIFIAIAGYVIKFLLGRKFTDLLAGGALGFLLLSILINIAVSFLASFVLNGGFGIDFTIDDYNTIYSIIWYISAFAYIAIPFAFSPKVKSNQMLFLGYLAFAGFYFIYRVAGMLGWLSTSIDIINQIFSLISVLIVFLVFASATFGEWYEPETEN